MATLFEELQRTGLIAQKMLPPSTNGTAITDYSQYLDPEVIHEHHSNVTLAKKIVYHKPKTTFSFKRKSGKLISKLEVQKIMGEINKDTATYHTLELLKEVNRGVTHTEMCELLGERYPHISNKPESVRAFLARINQVVPDVVSRENNDQGQRIWRYVSETAEGDLDTAYSRYLVELMKHIKEVKNARKARQHAEQQRLKDEAKFGFKMKKNPVVEDALEAERLTQDAVQATVAAATVQETAEKIQTMSKDILTEVQSKIEELKTIKEFRDNIIDDIKKELDIAELKSLVMTMKQLMQTFIRLQKGLSEDELKILRA